MLKEKNLSILTFAGLALFIILAIYLLTQDISLVGPI